MSTSVTQSTFPGLDLRSDPQETPGAIDLLNVECDQSGRIRSRDGYLALTASAGATRYDSVFAIAGSASVSSSAKFPGTGADDATVGTVAWTNLGNIFTSDGSYASATLSTTTVSHYLKATNFGFAVPAGATITGVAVEVRRYNAGGGLVGCNDSSVKLVKGGSITGTEHSAGSVWALSPQTVSYGGSTDLWGTTLSVADVNGATFGVVVSAVATGGVTSAIPSVDYAKITVYYQPLANVAVGGASLGRLDVISTDGAVAATLATATDTQQSYVAFGSPATSAVYIANSAQTIRKLVGTTFSQPAGMPKAKFVGLQTPSNRLVAANIATIPSGAGSTASTSLVHFSDALAPETWSANNYVYLTPGDNEDIQGIAMWRNHVLVFKSTKFFDFYGNGTNQDGSVEFTYRRQEGAGLAAPLATAVSPDGVYFLNRRGIYFTTGGPAQRISGPVDPLFQGGTSSAYQSGIINPSALAQASLQWFEDRLYVGLPLGSATTNSHTLVYDSIRQQWTLWDIPMGAMAVSASSPARLFFTYAQGANHLGQYAQNAYTTDAGTAISWRHRSGFNDLGTPDSEKVIREWLLDGTGSVTFKTAVNDSASLSAGVTVALGTAPAVAQGRDRTAVRGRNFSVEVSGTTPGSLSRLTANVREQRAPGVRSVAA